MFFNPEFNFFRRSNLKKVFPPLSLSNWPYNSSSSTTITFLFYCYCFFSCFYHNFLFRTDTDSNTNTKLRFVDASVVRYSFTINQQPRILYDYRGTSIFDPDGKVLQLEYALQATKLMSTVVGLSATISKSDIDNVKDSPPEEERLETMKETVSNTKTKNVLVLGSITRRLSRRQYPLYEILQRKPIEIGGRNRHISRENSEKPSEIISSSIYLIAPGVVAMGTGLTTDVQLLYDFIASQCIGYEYLYGSTMPLSRLVQSLSREMRSAERKNNPYAVSMLLVSSRNEKDEVSHEEEGRGDIIMYEIGPSGSYLESSSAVIGRNSQSVKKVLINEIEKNNNKDRVEKTTTSRNIWRSRKLKHSQPESEPEPETKTKTKEEDKNGWIGTIQVVMKALMVDLDYPSNILSLNKDPSKKIQPVDVSLILLDSHGKTDTYSTTLPDQITKKETIMEDKHQDHGNSLLLESSPGVYELKLYIKTGLTVSIPIMSSN